MSGTMGVSLGGSVGLGHVIKANIEGGYKVSINFSRKDED
jgi:glycine cleavage system aminomethyltransferase T